MSNQQAATDNNSPSLLPDFAPIAIYLCFVLSGIAALIYQIAWTRQFALLFGTSELAVAAVLAAYMGGLALGATCIERFLPRIARPLKLYAWLELGIAVSALLLIPAALKCAQFVLGSLLGQQSAPPAGDHATNSLFYLLSSFVALALPTTFMGATLPLLARHTVHSEEQIGPRIGNLYACNTAGAVVGALLASLLLLPQVGLSKTIWTAAGLNLIVAGLALALARTHAWAPSPAQQWAVARRPPLRFAAHAAPAWVLPLLLLSGSISFLHEVLWTRMLSHVLGGSIYAFGVMVASFLAGIAVGGSAGALGAHSRGSAVRWLAISELAAAAAAAAAWFAIQHGIPAQAALSTRIAFGFLILFPLACAIGATYPLAVRVLAENASDAALSSARVYAWNTVGAIVGAVGGGFVLIPGLGYEGAMQFAVVASCALAIAAVTCLERPARSFAGSIAALALAGAALFHPAKPNELLRLSPLQVNGAGEMVYYGVGRSADVVVLRQANRYMLRTNGLPEASMDAVGSIPLLNVETWMAPLAALARPDATSMLIVGLGAGRVIDAVPPSIHAIDVIELEPKVVEANRAVQGLRQHDPLRDARVHIILNDARGALSLTGKRYDTLVSQPSHPWTAGASHLYTREFLQQAREHLNPGGVFAQWMNTEFLDEGLFKSLIATLADVFPQIRVYRPAPTTLLLLASDAAIDPEHEFLRTRAALAQATEHYGRIGLNAVEDLVAALILDNEAARRFAAGATLITDDDNRFATDTVYDFGNSINLEILARILAPYDPLTHADSFVHAELKQALAFDYIGRRLAATALTDPNGYARLNAMADLFHDTDLAAYLRTLSSSDYQRPQTARDSLQAALHAHQDSALLRSAYLETWSDALAEGAAPGEVTALARPLNNEGALVLDIARKAADGAWAQVAGADAALARIPWTSLWKKQAVRLRLGWRSQAKEDRGRLSDEAAAIGDPVAMFDNDPLLAAARARNAMGADRPQWLLESIAQFASNVNTAAENIEPARRPALRAHLDAFGASLDALAKDSRLNPARVAEVRSDLQTADTTLAR